jgi:hypothetical protein
MTMNLTSQLNRAVESKDVVRGLQGFGLTQEALAHATGASERSVRNRLHTSSARPRSVERLHDLLEIVLLLSESLTQRGVAQWFQARNRLLGGHRSLDLLARGEYDKVREAAAAYVDGAYV